MELRAKNIKKSLPRHVKRHWVTGKRLIEQNGGTKSIFPGFSCPPSDGHAAAMIAAGMAGEPPFDFAPKRFVWEYILDDYNEFRSGINHSDGIKEEAFFFTSQREQWADLIFVFDIQPDLLPFLTLLKPSDLSFVGESTTLMFHQETKALAIKIIPVTKTAKKFNTKNLLLKKDESPSLFPKSTFAYYVCIGTPEYILNTEVDTERCELKSQVFENPSCISFTEHERQGLILLKGDDKKDHEVYVVKDHAGVTRYIGEGRAGRHAHVNSGTSHNPKINEYYFKYGEMHIKVVARGLSKYQALSIEKFMIAECPQLEKLWNKRDNPILKKDWEKRPEYSGILSHLNSLGHQRKRISVVSSSTVWQKLLGYVASFRLNL
jgi:hypothetical protein